MSLSVKLNFVEAGMSINVYLSISKVSRVMGIFDNCHILTSALPRSRKKAVGNFFVWILSILMCIQKFFTVSHMVEDLRRFPCFHIFCFDVALVKEKWHLARVLARSCWCQSVCQKNIKISAMDFPLTDQGRMDIPHR